MNDLPNLTPKQKRRVVTEFSAIEERLDTVLFRRNDDDDDDSNGILKNATIGAGVAGGGYGIGVGANALVRRGKRLNLQPGGPLAGADASAEVGQQWGGKIAGGGRSSTIKPNIMAQTERRFTLPGTTTPGASKGFLGDLKTGTKAGLGDAQSSLKELWEKLAKFGGKKLAKAV